MPGPDGFPYLPNSDRRAVQHVATITSDATPAVVTRIVASRMDTNVNIVCPWPWVYIVAVTDGDWALLGGNTAGGAVIVTSRDTGLPLVARVIDGATAAPFGQLVTYTVGNRLLPITPEGLSVAMTEAGGVAANGSYEVHILCPDQFLIGDPTLAISEEGLLSTDVLALGL